MSKNKKDSENPLTMLEKGVAVIAGQCKKLPHTPGVYMMLDEKGAVLYVGKAKSLKKRVTSYTLPARSSVRIQRMIALTRSMDFVHTHTEAEALLLEANLIKKHQPRYNILLRDDKSFPYILITGDHDFPLIKKHRGARNQKGEYFGPFAGAGDVNRTIAILQRVFKLRNCSDSYFAARTRPCLQYHIKRCTAPCVGLASKDQYAQQVAEARDFLNGKSRDLQKRFLAGMNEASAEMDYETAAHYRDRIQALSAIQARQDIHIEGIGDADVIALAQKSGQSCVQVVFFRAGQNYGSRSYFPKHGEDEAPGAILGAFIAQFYAARPSPAKIYVSHLPEDAKLIAQALGEKAGRACALIRPAKGAGRRVMDFALQNAAAALVRHAAERLGDRQALAELAEIFDLDEPPARIEVYDNSHISGTNMVGAMIVAGPEGFQKNAYRKFNIREAGSADDTGMMREVLQRRFSKALKEKEEGARTDWPDLLLIDGGQGQLNAARGVLEDLGIADRVPLVAIAKGKDRNAGRERFFMAGRRDFQLPLNAPVLHYLQRLRDEAHRFAIGSHRARRKKQIVQNVLDDIPGIGASRKKILLQHFGSAKAVEQAGIADLQKVEGISAALAQKIYEHFH